MNVYEVTLHGTDSINLLAPTKDRALELVGDYLADAGRPDMLESGEFVGPSSLPRFSNNSNALRAIASCTGCISAFRISGFRGHRSVAGGSAFCFDD
jgi:hypothetical protein